MRQRSERIHYKMQNVKNLTIPLISTALLLAACGGGTTGDTTAPTVGLNASQSSTTINLVATASDDVAVTKVEFYRGSETTPFATDTTAPYTASFTVSSANNGTLNVTAKAYDAAGNQSQSGTQVAVSVAQTDTTAPLVELAADFPSTPDMGTLTATVNEPVSKVEFYWNGKLAATDTTAPYSAAFDLDQRQNGSVVLVAKAYDLAGNIGIGSITKVLNIHTLYQGQWGWITFTDPQNVEGSIQDNGVVILNDQFLSSKGKTIAYGGYYAAQPNQTGDAYLGDLINDGSVLMDLVYPQSDQSYLTGRDKDGLSIVDGEAVFLGYAGVFSANGTLQKDLYVIMVQLNTDPYNGSSISTQSLKSQSGSLAKAHTLAVLKTLASKGNLNSLSSSVSSQSIQRLKH